MMGKIYCYFCGGELQWSGDANASDVSGEYREDDPAVVSLYTCARCGRDYEIFEPDEDARMGEYKDYWHGDGA